MHFRYLFSIENDIAIIAGIVDTSVGDTNSLIDGCCIYQNTEYAAWKRSKAGQCNNVIVDVAVWL